MARLCVRNAYEATTAYFRIYICPAHSRQPCLAPRHGTEHRSATSPRHSANYYHTPNHPRRCGIRQAPRGNWRQRTFVKTLEQALLAGQADAAVHSGKDVETALAANTEIVAILPRGDRRDALIGAYANLDELPQNARIGTASVRRVAALRQHRPDVNAVLLRGNVHSRIQALQEGAYDAIILAMAGLNRLGITADVHPLTEEEMLPAAAQGAILVQTRTPQSPRQQYAQTHFKKIHDPISGAEISAERTFLATLDGSCRTPIAASAHISGDKIHFRGWLASLDGTKIFTDAVTTSASDGINIAREMGLKLLEQAGEVSA